MKRYKSLAANRVKSILKPLTPVEKFFPNKNKGHLKFDDLKGKFHNNVFIPEITILLNHQ